MTPARASGRYDLVVIGGGLVGLATALQVLRLNPGLSLAVVEKERTIARHQSGRNSGVVHAGLYYAPESLKAELCREGRRLLLEFADEHGIPYRLCGKLVVALDETDLARLDRLEERGRLNGLRELRMLDQAELRSIEPAVRGVRGLHVPESGVIDYRTVADAYAREVRRKGGEVLVGRRVVAIHPRHRSIELRTSAGRLEADSAIACAGVFSDRVAALAGAGTAGYRIVPFRGDYYTFRRHAETLVKGLVYPVPDPAFPFLGIHFTRRLDGRLLAGPNAVPALAREGYRRSSISASDALELLGSAGFRRLARRYWRTGATEIWRDIDKTAFLRRMRRYVPGIALGDVAFGPSGIRAQCVAADGSLVDDFLFAESPRMLHVLNAPSPAATASLAIGQRLATTISGRIGA